MKRRLNIGLGMLNDPALLLLDEPTVGVDPQSRNAILDSVEALASEGMAVLYTTHYMEEAERLCDRVGILDEGSLKAEGTRRELIALGRRARPPADRRARATYPRPARRRSRLPGVEEAVPREGGLDLMARDVRASLAEIVRAIDDTGAGITSIEVRGAEPGGGLPAPHRQSPARRGVARCVTPGRSRRRISGGASATAPRSWWPSCFPSGSRGSSD